MPGIRQLFLDHVAQTSDSPLMFQPVRGEGVHLFDKHGKAHLDLISGVGVSAMGHCHPDVVKAIQLQSEKYLHTMVYGEHIQEPQVLLADFLSSLLPDTLQSVYFVNSGSEAVEGAMKLAGRFTGRKEIIALRNAYHGGTRGAMSLMSDPYFSRAYRPHLPGIRFVGQNRREELKIITDKTAAVILETIQGEAGFRVPDHDFMQAVRQRCNETGALLIFDEIQAGMGRTGTLWAFQQFGVVPDVLLLAKGFGGGMPLGAFVASPQVMSALTSQPVLGHITTFGGHPVCCAAAFANLKALVTGNWIDSVKQKGALFRETLRHDLIKEIRGIGLMLAVELPGSDHVQRVMQLGLESGFLTDWFLFDDCSFRICPPLIITEVEIEQVCHSILDVLDKIKREAG